MLPLIRSVGGDPPTKIRTTHTAGGNRDKSGAISADITYKQEQEEREKALTHHIIPTADQWRKFSGATFFPAKPNLACFPRDAADNNRSSSLHHLVRATKETGGTSGFVEGPHGEGEGEGRGGAGVCHLVCGARVSGRISPAPDMIHLSRAFNSAYLADYREPLFLGFSTETHRSKFIQHLAPKTVKNQQK